MMMLHTTEERFSSLSALCSAVEDDDDDEDGDDDEDDDEDGDDDGGDDDAMMPLDMKAYINTCAITNTTSTVIATVKAVSPDRYMIDTIHAYS